MLIFVKFSTYFHLTTHCWLVDQLLNWNLKPLLKLLKSKIILLFKRHY